MNEIWNKLLAFIGARQQAYVITFGSRVKRSGAQKAVLADLAKFCRAHTTTWDDNQRKSDVLIGRREVFLRIQEHLQLSTEELAELYALIPKPKEPEA